jgi:hypothetical protein
MSRTAAAAAAKKRAKDGLSITPSDWALSPQVIEEIIRLHAKDMCPGAEEAPARRALVQAIMEVWHQLQEREEEGVNPGFEEHQNAAVEEHLKMFVKYRVKGRDNEEVTGRGQLYVRIKDYVQREEERKQNENLLTSFYLLEDIFKKQGTSTPVFQMLDEFIDAENRLTDPLEKRVMQAGQVTWFKQRYRVALATREVTDIAKLVRFIAKKQELSVNKPKAMGAELKGQQQQQDVKDKGTGPCLKCGGPHNASVRPHWKSPVQAECMQGGKKCDVQIAHCTKMHAVAARIATFHRKQQATDFGQSRD